MAWFQASVLGALLTVCASQYPFGDTAGFEPFTNFDQYAQTRASSTNGGFRPSSQSFASPTSSDGNYEVSRSFNFDRESLNGNPIARSSFSPRDIQASRYSFDEGRQIPSVSQNGFRLPSSSYTPTTERPRYYEPPAVTYQPRPIQVPTYQAPPYQQPVEPRYQAPTPAPQYSPPIQQYSPPVAQNQAQQAPQYQPRPAPVQYAPPPQPAPQPRPRPIPPPQVEAPVYQPTARPYQPPVQQQYRPAPPPEEPYRSPQKVAPVSSRSRNEVTEKPAVVHAAAPVHYVSIGQKLEGDYKFGYDTGKASNGDESFRRETRDPDGTVRGSYGYVDTNGKQIVVHYEAGKEGYKVLSESEAKQRAEQAQRAAAQPQPAAQAPIQQYRPPVQQQAQAVLAEEPPQRRVRRIKKKRRERRAVDDDDEPEENGAKENFGSRVSGTGSLRPTGSPRIRPGRTRRPLNPDGRSLRPTGSPSPVRERSFRTRVVVRTTTPLPQPSARPTVPRRQIIPSVPSSTPASYEEQVIQPQPKRRRKVRRKFRTTAAPELQQLQAPSPQTPASPPTAPAVPQAPTGQLPAHVLPPTFLQSPVSNQSHYLNSYNNIQTHTNNPYVQHVNSPQSLYEQLTSSIYQEAGRVSPSRSFNAQPQYSSQPYQPPYQNIQYGSANFQPQFSNAQPQYNQFPQYQQSGYQFPQQQYQQSRFLPRYAHPQSQDLYSYPSNIEYSRNLLSYDIGAAQ